MEGWGGGENRRGERGETMIKIYNMKKIFSRKKINYLSKKGLIASLSRIKNA